MPERAAGSEHDWRDDGLDTHRGEYWYRCARCGRADWIASYGTMDQLMPRKCEPPAPRRPHDAGSHDQPMTPAVQRVIDEADKRARDKAAMPEACPTATGCREHGCHGACMPPNDRGMRPDTAPLPLE